MFRIDSEKQLLSTFRPRDRRNLELPKGLQYPLFINDYLTWTEQSGLRLFLVFARPGSRTPIGIAFRREQGEKGLAARVCDWCHSYGSGLEIGLMMADLNSKHRVGLGLCLDMRCREKIEQSSNLAGRSPVELSHQLLERMYRFAHEGLGIEAGVEQQDDA
jgi:hypothetical protein